MLYLLLGPDLYWTMVLGRGWTERQLANWTEGVILHDLCDLEPPQNPYATSATQARIGDWRLDMNPGFHARNAG